MAAPLRLLPAPCFTHTPRCAALAGCVQLAGEHAARGPTPPLREHALDTGPSLPRSRRIAHATYQLAVSWKRVG